MGEHVTQSSTRKRKKKFSCFRLNKKTIEHIQSDSNGYMNWDLEGIIICYCILYSGYEMI